MRYIQAYNTTLYRLIISLILVIVFFPVHDINLYSGLDSSYKWALNYLFSNDVAFFNEMFYPYGVLGFIKHPAVIANNPLWTILFIFSINLGFTYFLLWHIRDKENHLVQFAAIGVLAVIMFFTRIDITIPLFLLTLLWAWNKSRKKLFLIFALVLSAFVIYIKVSIAVNTMGILFLYALSVLIRKKDFKTVAFSFLAFVILSALIGFIFTGKITYFVHYFENIIKMTLSYGGALAVYAENNIVLTLTGLVSLIILIIVHRKTDIIWIFLIMSVTIFGFWKHGMIRQDIFHYQLWFLFLICFLLTIPFLYQKIKAPYILLAGITIIAFVINKENTAMAQYYNTAKKNPAAFVQYFFNYNDWINEAKENSKENLKKLQLPKEIIDKIGNSKCDIYPWNLSYIPANNLNYHPRVSLQSGAYAEWLDNKSVKSLENNPPDYIWFHFTYDNYGNPLGNYDSRLLTNDEPFSIVTVFYNYEIVETLYNGMLLKYSPKTNKPEVVNTAKSELKENEYIKIPENKTSIIRLKLKIEENLLHKVKSTFYKPDIYYLDYMFENGNIYRHRFIPENAQSGLWISPFLDLSVNDNYKLVDSIKFSSYPDTKSAKAEIQWQFLSKSGFSPFSSNNISANKLVSDSILPEYKNSVNRDNMKLDNSHMINPKEFSHGFNYEISDTLRTIRAGVWSHIDNNKASLIVIEVKEDDNNMLYKTTTLKPKLSTDKWNYISISHHFDKDILPGAVLKCYVWNNGKEPVFIDDLSLSVWK